jgi:hypothetical protein
MAFQDIVVPSFTGFVQFIERTKTSALGESRQLGVTRVFFEGHRGCSQLIECLLGNRIAEAIRCEQLGGVLEFAKHISNDLRVFGAQ